MATIQWAGRPVKAEIAAVVDEYSRGEGLPLNVGRAFVLAESDGNPDAIGDNGASVGLLQLHERGQGAGMTVAERRDPARNLAVGMPHIGRAWRANAHLSGRARILRTAAESGHPGDPDTFPTGHRAKEIAIRGTNAIADMWEALERDRPTIPDGTSANVAGVPLEGVDRVFEELARQVRAHPVGAALAGAGAVALLLL